MYKLKNHGPDIQIQLAIVFGEWNPSVGEDAEDTREFRIYNDGVWEFLDKNGLPICQGVDAKISILDVDKATILNREKDRHD